MSQMFLFCSLAFFRPRAEIVAKVKIAKTPPPTNRIRRLRLVLKGSTIARSARGHQHLGALAAAMQSVTGIQMKPRAYQIRRWQTPRNTTSFTDIPSLPSGFQAIVSMRFLHQGT